MKWTKQRLNNLFFIIGVVAVVVMILTFDVSFAELWEHLKRAGYWLIPIIGIWVFVYGLNALGWQSIIRSNTDEKDVDFAKTIARIALAVTDVTVKIVVIEKGKPLHVLEFDPQPPAHLRYVCLQPLKLLYK